MSLRAFLALLFFAIVAPIVGIAVAQNNWVAPGNQTAGGSVQMCLNSAGQAVPFNGPTCGVTVFQSGAVGTTGAVSATIPGVANKTAYICGWAVSATGSGAVGPISIQNLINTNQTYQATASATGGVVAQAQYTPCIPANAQNTGIAVTTTADASATAVDVNVWGYYF
jgi:hypothetical protein